MRSPTVLLSLATFSALALFTADACAAPRVELEVCMQEGAPITAAQDWAKLLGSVGFDYVNIRQHRFGDEVRVTTTGSGDTATHRLVGLLRANNTLVLKGGSFTARDVGRLKDYLATLRLDGARAVNETRGAFGLTDEQLQAVTVELSKPFAIATKGVSPNAVLAKVRGRLAVRLVVDQQAAESLASAEPCLDEVEEFTTGTALAALLRPYGLMLMPERPVGGEAQLRVTKAVASAKPWPIGWPPEGGEKETLPILFEFLNVEIDGVGFDEAFEAIRERLEVPALFDHNMMALHQIDTSEVTVRVPSGRSYYKKILDRILFQTRLKTETRVDELGNPFLWITTVKN